MSIADKLKFITFVLLIINSVSFFNKQNWKKNFEPLVTNETDFDNIIFKGMTFVGDKYCPDVNYSDDLASLSMKKLSDIGANWVAIVVTEYQDKVNSTDIYPLYDKFKYNNYFTFKTEKIEGIIKQVVNAKSLGMKVMLKPHIDLTEEPDANLWRGDIGKNMTQINVKNWFKSYEKFILKYAKLAEDLQVEMFSVSCELIIMSKYEFYWRDLIQKIRNVYSGPLVDSANHDGEEYDKKWWDTMDYIGVDAYYLSIYTDFYKNNLTAIENIFDDTISKLRNLSEVYKKDVIITEVGFCSGNCKRNQTATPYDQFLQAEFYNWFYKIFSKQKFVRGFFWWSWNSDPYYGGSDDTCISPQYKVTEQILRHHYKSNTTMSFEPANKPKCNCTI